MLIRLSEQLLIVSSCPFPDLMKLTPPSFPATKGVFTPTKLGSAPEMPVAGAFDKLKSAFKNFKFGATNTTETVHVVATPRPKIRIRRSTYQSEAERMLDSHEQDKRHEHESSDEEEATSPIIVPATFEKKFGAGREKKFGHGRAGSRTSNVIPWDDIATVVNPSKAVRSGYYGESDK